MNKDIINFQKKVKTELSKTKFKDDAIEVSIFLKEDSETKESIIDYRLFIWSKEESWKTLLQVSEKSVPRFLAKLDFEIKMMELD